MSNARSDRRNAALAAIDAGDVESAVALWDEQTFDAWRIAIGAPLYGREISADQLPQEASRTAQAISFTKGCYLGQEPVARIDSLGHVNWELVTFQLAATPSVAPSPTPSVAPSDAPCESDSAAGQSAAGVSAAGVLVPGAVLAVDGKPVLKIATIMPWSVVNGGPATSPGAEAPWTHAGLGYVRREARRAARSAGDAMAEGVLATPAGIVRIEPRLFHG